MILRFAIVVLGLAAPACTIELIDQHGDDDRLPDGGPILPDAAAAF